MRPLAGRAAKALLAGLALLAGMAAAEPVRAQRAGCGLGLALERLAEADRRLAEPPTTLVAGRATGGEVESQLQTAATELAGCGCRQAAASAAEAAGLLEQAGAEASLLRLRATLDRARFSARLARERLGRQGCS